MSWRRSVRLGAAAAVLLTGCTPVPEDPGPVGPPVPASSGRAATAAPAASRRIPAATPARVRRTERADPRWRFYTRDRRRYRSPWFAGAHRVMIEYGCTRAPYYPPDPRCRRNRGFHHGVDVAMPCGTRLFSAVRGRVVDPRSPGAPGPAYGPYAFRIRSHGKDILVGHVRRVYVDPGQAVRRRQLVARASDQAAPDGCHLHFEVRPVGGGYLTAVRPHPSLMLAR